ncbi:hypothetical protein Caka_0330 [Coraliomargarita akajimensis DSM 45221]|uniref:Uncharacterized protein n=1 Tax=Coraliomargarita akajimensis (strain DSM 45221 / IAM 15411 / JCM 23193 / KCTC 12865 / 04OKA010-24) TaxID=583355 RepID=D5EME9_CORAD|nr:hypothetical protein Caka_0330 [Coraliomargarita akajimensis DSM 45221]
MYGVHRFRGVQDGKVTAKRRKNAKPCRTAIGWLLAAMLLCMRGFNHELRGWHGFLHDGDLGRAARFFPRDAVE